MVLTASDQGRAIFAILDLNRDRRLGVREVRGTVDRVASWDRDGDGRVAADEIPHHFQLTIGRGELAGIGNAGVAVAAAAMTAARRAGRRRPELVPPDGPQPRRRRLPPRVPRPPRPVRPPRPRPRRPDRRRRGPPPPRPPPPARPPRGLAANDTGSSRSVTASHAIQPTADSGGPRPARSLQSIGRDEARSRLSPDIGP